jgi:prepilin-type N-terminal cleavage/methylation domain-containing protein
MTRLAPIALRRGFTLIELIVVMAIIALLSSIAVPRYIDGVERAREASLRSSLATLRDAIDQFSADRGRYPDSLVELVRARYLRELPEDPITRGRASWVGVRPPPDSQVPGRLFDVRSGAAGRGRDGRLYADW